jgi:D-arabinose 1-dehydrogenase-like Zn-dependent alcohol dehydrogenase
MARLVHLGKIQIKVAREFELSQIRDAYIRAKKGNLDGKVIVKIK